MLDAGCWMLDGRSQMADGGRLESAGWTTFGAATESLRVSVGSHCFLSRPHATERHVFRGARCAGKLNAGAVYRAAIRSARGLSPLFIGPTGNPSRNLDAGSHPHHLPSAICHLPSAIRHLPSAICHLPSAIRHPPSAICHLPSGICHLASSIQHPASSIR